MVYIRPIAPVITSTAIKPVGRLAHSHEDHSLESDVVVSEYLDRPHAERRKQQDDRRQERKDSMVETRAGRDRRKNQPSINISI